MGKTIRSYDDGMKRIKNIAKGSKPKRTKVRFDSYVDDEDDFELDMCHKDYDVDCFEDSK